MDRENREIEENMSDQSAAKGTSTSLQDMSDKLILEIFGFCDMSNNLPLVNKHFNKLLKFGPKYKGERGWMNTSVAMDIIETRFLVDFNQGINFHDIQSSIDSYNRSLQVHETIHSNSPYLQKTKTNLAMFERNILEFQNQQYGLSSYVNKFEIIGAEIIEEVENKYPGVVVHLPEYLKSEVEMRYHYSIFSGIITSYYDNMLKTATETGNEPDNKLEEFMQKKISNFLIPFLERQGLESPIIYNELGLDYELITQQGQIQ